MVENHFLLSDIIWSTDALEGNGMGTKLFLGVCCKGIEIAGKPVCWEMLQNQQRIQSQNQVLATSLLPNNQHQQLQKLKKCTGL